MVDEPMPGNVASLLLTEILEHDDENGALANATADDLRDALRLAADRLRTYSGRRPSGPIYRGARRLTAEVWRLVELHTINARSPAGDAALDLRDSIDPEWWPVAEEERPGW